MKVTKEDLTDLIKKLDLHITGLKHPEIDPETRINVTIIGLTSLRDHIENNIDKVEV